MKVPGVSVVCYHPSASGTSLKECARGPRTARRAQTQGAAGDVRSQPRPAHPGPVLCERAPHPHRPGDEWDSPAPSPSRWWVRHRPRWRVRGPRTLTVQVRTELQPGRLTTPLGHTAGTSVVWPRSSPPKCQTPPHRSHLLPLARNTHWLVHSWARFLSLTVISVRFASKSAPFPTPWCEMPFLPLLAVPSPFLQPRSSSLLLWLLIQCQPFSSIFILFWGIILKCVRVSVISNYFKPIGPSSKGGLEVRARILSFLASVPWLPAALTDTVKGQALHCTGFPGWQLNKTWKPTQKTRSGAATLHCHRGMQQGETLLFTNRNSSE